MSSKTFRIKSKKLIISSLIDLLKAIIKDKTILEYKDRKGNDLYLLLSFFGHPEIMEFLKKEINWDIYVKNSKGCNAFLLAAFNGCLNVIKYLLNEHNLDIHVKTKNGNDAFLLAARNGQLHIMKFLVKECNWNIHVRNNLGYNAFHYGNKEIRKYLLKLYKKERVNRKRKIVTIQLSDSDRAVLQIDCLTLTYMTTNSAQDEIYENITKYNKKIHNRAVSTAMNKCIRRRLQRRRRRLRDYSTTRLRDYEKIQRLKVMGVKRLRNEY